MVRSALLLTAALALGLGIGGATAEPAAPEGQAGSPPATIEADPLLARVNGEEIRQSDILAAKGLLPAEFRNLPDAVLAPVLLDQVIDRRLAAAAARAKKIDQDPAVIREMAQARDSVLEQAYLSRAIASRTSDAEIRKRFEARLKAFIPQTEAHARHILTKTEDEARMAHTRIKRGERFEEVAKAVSIDGSAEAGGDLGYFTADQMVPEFSQAVFALKVGAISEPFESRFGWHVARVDDLRPEPKPTLEALRTEIEEELATEIVEDEVKSLRAKAVIERPGVGDASPVVTLPPNSELRGTN